jgi:hypothetical protein
MFLMKAIITLFASLLAMPAFSFPHNSGFSELLYNPISVQDTLKERQMLYNGLLWTNKYHKFEGDQYLFSDIFLPGSLSFNNHLFRNLQIRYDILSDEIMIPQNRDVIIQLNKEMVDSFTLVFDNKVYHFLNLRDDSLIGSSGYFNVLYQGKSTLYVKYIKTIATVITDRSNGYFNEIMHLILILDGKDYKISRLRDFIDLVPVEKERIRSYMREKRLRVTIKNPGSFIPVIRYYDSLKN